MKFSKLIQSTEYVKTNATPPSGIGSSAPKDSDIEFDPEIGSIHYQSQDVKPGGLFVAIPGHTADGHDFIDEALQKGALAIVTQKPIGKKEAFIIQVKNTRKALAEISSQFYNNPSKDLYVIGITGTNGKTTTAYLIESILTADGIRTGLIGTINYRYAGKSFENPVTTPESLDLQRIMAEMRRHGTTHVILEVSSHAVDLNRIRNCSFDIGIFTNLTQDHLDYHGNMDSYWNCKKRFFTEYIRSGPKKDRALAIINCDHPKGKELASLLGDRMLTTGHHDACTIRHRNVRSSLSGISGEILTPAGDFMFKSHLAGKHNLENILLAAGVGVTLNLSAHTIQSGIADLSCIPGRLERIRDDSGRHVYVDYAHTPDALENVLSSLRLATSGRIFCVFGCGGDRDKDKRSKMGEVAGKICDLTIITSDNPRTEAPDQIIAQIREGIIHTAPNRYTRAEVTCFGKKGYVVEPDRKKAIQLGVSATGPGDTLLIAGKGHETYQLVGKQTLPFDDRLEAKRALKASIFSMQSSAETQCC